MKLSFAEWVKRALRPLRPPAIDKPWMQFAGMVESGDSASSNTIDDFVYLTKD